MVFFHLESGISTSGLQELQHTGNNLQTTCNLEKYNLLKCVLGPSFKRNLIPKRTLGKDA